MGGNSTDVRSMLTAERALPVPTQDNDDVEQRGSRYGDTIGMLVSPKGLVAADEGSYFIATNPTPGTGIATLAAPTTFVDTSPFLILQNNWTATDPRSRRIYLDYLRLQCTAAGTNGSAIRWAIRTDTSTNRWTSGGSTLTPVNVNQDDGTSSKAVINVGALVASAATGAARLLGSSLIRPVIPVVGDTYVINFGGHENGLNSLAPAGVAIANVQINTSPVVIGPGQVMLFHLWLTAQSAASSYEIELGYIER